MFLLESILRPNLTGRPMGIRLSQSLVQTALPFKASLVADRRAYGTAAKTSAVVAAASASDGHSEQVA